MNTIRCVTELEATIAAARTDRQRIDKMFDLCLELRARDIVRAGGIARQAMALARKIGYSYGIAVGYIRYADCDRLNGRPSRAIRYLDRAESLLADDPRGADIFPHLYRTRGMLQLARGQTFDAIQSLEYALTLNRDCDDRRNIATTLAFLGDAYRIVGDYSAALAALEESLEIAEEIDAPGWIALALTNLACVYGDLEDAEPGLECACRALELVRTTGNLHAEAHSHRIIGEFQILRREYQAARREFEEARELFHHFDASSEIAYCEASIACIDLLADCGDESWQRLGAAIDVVRDVGDDTLLAIVLGMQGRAFVNAGLADDAIGPIEESLALFDEINSCRQMIKALHVLIAARGQLGDETGVLRHLLRIRVLEERFNRQEALKNLARIEAGQRLKAFEEDRSRSASRITEMAAELERRDAEIATISLRLSQREELVIKLRSDVTRYLRDMKGDTPALARMLTERLQPGTDDTVGWEAFEDRFAMMRSGFIREFAGRYPLLTQTELKLCAYIRIGLANKEIATITCSSIHTVNTHRRNIRRKIGLALGASLDTMLARFAP